MSTQHLDLEALNSLLRTRVLGKAAGWPNEVWVEIDSTNTRARDLAMQGAPDGLIIASRAQTAGRGRLGRTWVSPPDAGVYLSFVLRPPIPLAETKLISFAAGVAVAEAIADVSGLTVGLKWVNDIVYGGKKLGGILAEMAGDQGSAPALIVGIGINLKLPSGAVPDAIASSAVWLEQIAQQPVDPNQLAAAVAHSLEKQYAELTARRASEILSRWKNHSITLGRRVKAQTGQQELEGTAADLAADGALILKLDSGETVTLHAGDVSIRNADGSYA